MLTLVLGGARSGKSQFAERLASKSPGPVTYLATGQITDNEMAERVENHRAQRPQEWQTIEAPLQVAQVVGRLQGVVLLDCLTFLINNLLYHHPETAEQQIQQELEQLAIAAHGCHLIVVSNEVGLGLVPETPLGRRFRDLQGRANQQLAAVADQVYFVVAGLPMIVKDA